MLYPNTQSSGVVGGQDNKKRLQQLLSRTGAAPLFGSSGRSASVETLPNVGAPALSFNPFLKMLAGHPNETMDSLPNNNPLSGFVGSSVPTTTDSPANGGAQPMDSGAADPGPGYSPAPNGGYVPSQGPFGNNFVPINDSGQGWTGSSQPQAASGPTGLGLSPSNPFYHTLMQLAMYGLDQ
jgi:hypothetical protein